MNRAGIGWWWALPWVTALAMTGVARADGERGSVRYQILGSKPNWIEQELLIGPDRVASLRTNLPEDAGRPNKVRLEQSEYDALMQAFAEARFFEQPDSFEQRYDTGASAQVIAFRTSGRAKVIEAPLDATLPAELTAVRAKLIDLMGQLRENLRTPESRYLDELGLLLASRLPFLEQPVKELLISGRVWSHLETPEQIVSALEADPFRTAVEAGTVGANIELARRLALDVSGGVRPAPEREAAELRRILDSLDAPAETDRAGARSAASDADLTRYYDTLSNQVRMQIAGRGLTEEQRRAVLGSRSDWLQVSDLTTMLDSFGPMNDLRLDREVQRAREAARERSPEGAAAASAAIEQRVIVKAIADVVSPSSGRASRSPARAPAQGLTSELDDALEGN